MWLDESEFMEFLRELITVVQPRLANVPIEVAACDRGLRPRRGVERLREHDLGDLIHRGGIVVDRGRPVRRHLLVGHPPHDVRPGPTDAIEFPTLQLVRLGEGAGATVVPCDEPVD
jgi:hypothetical protein